MGASTCWETGVLLSLPQKTGPAKPNTPETWFMTKDDALQRLLWKTLPGPAHKIIYAACMSRSPEIKLNSDFVPSLPSLTLPTDYQKRRVWLLRALPDEENRRSEAGLVYDDDLEHRYSFSNRAPAR